MRRDGHVMSSRHLPTTEETLPSTDVEDVGGVPTLLGVFPKSVALGIPRAGDIVGRAWLDDAGMTDAKVSREHVSFSRPGGRLHIKDNQSQNGTFVDGVRLEPNVATQIDDGSVIRMGQTIFVYREAFAFPMQPQPPLGKLVGPWALGRIRHDLIARTYRRGLNVLLEGATGTGKELLAEEIARQFRPGTKMVPINVAAIPRESFEGYMFGWEKNSFTGGFQAYTGLLRSGAGGSVFLDEIEALPVELQPKLLRFFEQRQIQPLGAREIPPPIDCLAIAATNRSIQDLLAKDAFRRDLIARFQLRLVLPPLEERPEDLFAIFVSRWEHVFGRFDLSKTRIDPEAIERMMRHDWPENVRELFRIVDGLDPRAGLKKSTLDRIWGPESEIPLSRRCTVLTNETVERALADCQGNQSRAARVLGVSRPALLRWLRKNTKCLAGQNM
jgi:sigma-54 dependent transcriptional regulator, acetoin dehydrogenase operon transcriptional activator AcoR